jgi:hypothetical protein
MCRVHFPVPADRPDLGNLLVHVLPSHTGKASPAIVARLEEVVDACESQDLHVIARAFDGDSSYHAYHVPIAQYAREAMPLLGQGVEPDGRVDEEQPEAARRRMD